jgi:hypothetical protein
MNQDAKRAEPVRGAAEYLARPYGDKWEVRMYTSKGDMYGTLIQTCSNEEIAEKVANRWQKKENKAVLKAQGQI